MRNNLILASGAVAALLWVSPAAALGFETICENAKLRAASHYFQCLTYAHKRASAHGEELSDAVARCDERFDRAFERAEADGACRTAGGPATLRGPIRGQIEETLAAVKNGPGCPTPITFDRDTSTYACRVVGLTSSSAVDLAAIVTQIDDPNVTDDTVVWIEVWGGDGGPGNQSNGGSAGIGGYAQTTTTVSHLREFRGTSEIYYCRIPR